MLQSLKGLFKEPPGIYQSWTSIGLAVGVFCTFAYAFFALQSTSMEMWTHDLSVLALLVALVKAPRPARTDPILMFFGAFILLSLFSYAQTHLFLPQYAEERVYFHKLSAIFGFFAVAWWLGGDRRRVFWMLALALAGLFAAIYLHASGYQFIWALRGRRADFGFQNAQHAAMFLSVGLIGWSVFALRFLRPGRMRGLRYVAWGVVLAVLVAGVVVTQTRAAWLGLAVALAAAGVLGVWQARGAPVVNVSRLLVAVMIGAVVVAVLVGRFAKPLEERLRSESEVMSQLARGTVEELPDTNIGIRVKLWRESADWIAKRPLTGWGYEIRARFINDNPDISDKARVGHVHNSYLEILLIYGLIGMALFGGLIAYITTRVWRHWRAGGIPNDVALFGFCFLAFWLVVNMFESYVFGKTGVYLTGIVLGSVYTFVLAPQLRPQDLPSQSARAAVEG